jgi:hypothetical protein
MTTAQAGDSSADGRCAVSGRFTVELAHLSPSESREDKAWFSNNAMALYDPHTASNANDCPANRIYLDYSLHAALGSRLWVFVPRHSRFAIQTVSLPDSHVWYAK